MPLPGPGPGPFATGPEPVELELDELEAMRLVDLLRKDQSAAGAEMGVSRGTVQRLLYSGRRKVVQALLEGRPIRIRTGRAVRQHLARFRCTACGYECVMPAGFAPGWQRCPRCGSPLVHQVGLRAEPKLENENENKNKE